ncbi:MAG TPA: PAS domain S-box protein [Syntrophorhabdales bacterium]|nr:PAS domain S-box protein [Syntrophorhabdales bacterium]
MAGEKILIVEDEGIVARETEYRLKDLGYTVCGVAASGAEAIKKAEKARPDVVLMDIMLKGEMDGVDAAEQIHSTLSVPVVYVTAHADETTVQRAKRTEPMGYLLKPFNERELHAAIEIAIYKHTTEKIVKDREQLLATTLKSIGDAVIVTDLTGAVTFMNPAAELLTRWKLKEASGTPVTQVFSVVSETTHTLAQHPVMRALSESIITTARNHVLTSKGGREIGVDGTATPIVDDTGAVHGAVLVFRDVGGYRKADESLRITQHSVDLLLEAVVRFGSDGRIFYANEAASRMLGYSWDDLTWMNMQDLDPSLKGSRWDLHMERLKEKVTLTYETSLQPKKDGPVTVEVRAHYFLHDHGEFVVALLRDIAQEKARLESRLKEGVYARGLIDSANVMIIGLDREGAIHTFNKEVEIITGYAKSALQGKNLFEVILPISKNVSIWRSFLDWQASRLQLPVTFETALVTKSGTKRLISWCINETKDEQAISGLVLVGVDVTDSKQMEQHLALRNEELLSLRRVSEILMKPAVSVEDVFQTVSEEVASAINYPFVAIEQYDDEMQRMILKGVKSLIPVPPNMEVPLSETLSGVAVRTGHLLVERAAAKRPEYANGFLKKLGISTYICVPITVNQRVFGALTLGHTEAADVSDQLQHYAIAVANHLALFLCSRESSSGGTGSEEALREFFGAWPEAVFECSDGMIRAANQAAITLVKAGSREEVVGKPLLELIDGDYRKLLQPYLQEDAHQVAPLPFTDVGMRALDGSPLNTELAMRMAGLLGKGKVIAVARDISERRDRERKAWAMAEEWRKLVDEQPDAVAVLQGDTYLYLNQRCGQLFGYDNPEELLGKSVKLNLHAEDAERLIGEQQPSAPVSRLEFKGIRRDGSSLHGEAFVKMIRYEGSERTWVRFADISAGKREADEQKKTEAQFQWAFEMATVPLLLLDEAMNILDLNRASENLLDIRKDEVKDKKNLTEFLAAEDAETVRREVSEVENGSAGPLPGHRLIRKDGVVKNIYIGVSPMLNKGGRIMALMERAQTSQGEVLQKGDNGYSAIFEKIGTPAFVAGQDSIVSLANEEFEKLCACSRQELEGKKSWHEFIVKEDLPAVEEYLRMLLSDPDQAARRHDFKVLSSDGAIKEMRLTATPIPGSDKIVFCLVDMRERKWAEQAWLESEKKYRHVVDTVLEGIWVLDADGSTTFVSDRMAQMLKYGPEEMMGKRFFLFIGVKNAEKAGQRWERCRQGIKEEYEAEFMCKDGQPINTRVSSAPMIDDTGTFHGSMFSVADISHRKEAEEKIKASLQEKEVYLREIHHRVKNNLQVVSSLLYLQSKNVNDPRTLEILLESLERVRTIALIHEQLYKSADLAHVNFRDYLNSLTTNLFQTYGIQGEAVKLKLEINERVSLTPDKAIPCGLIVNELVSNALRHAFVGHGKGTIHVELRQNDDGTTSLIVGDDGIGLPPHVDFRHTSSLGLQLVNTLVNQLGATVELTLKKGTVFTVIFA